MTQNNQFQHIVLQLLWLIVCQTAGKRPLNQLYSARSNCISFGDQFGTEGEEAKKYRREMTYWWID